MKYIFLMNYFNIFICKFKKKYFIYNFFNIFYKFSFNYIIHFYISNYKKIKIKQTFVLYNEKQIFYLLKLLFFLIIINTLNI